MRFWREDEQVDGSGRNVREAAKALIEALKLTEEQKVLFCHTFGNILPLIDATVDHIVESSCHSVEGARIGRALEQLQEIHKAIRESIR